jgi:hypothetical protein
MSTIDDEQVSNQRSASNGWAARATVLLQVAGRHRSDVSSALTTTHHALCVPLVDVCRLLAAEQRVGAQRRE